MYDISDIIKLIKNDIPFSFVRFNDGEMMAIDKVGVSVARGDQKVNESLHLSLKEAILFRYENYWIGKPCGTCFPKHRKLYDSMVEADYKYQTRATVLCNNGNWKKFINECKNGLFKDKRIFWVGGNNQKIEKLKEIDIYIYDNFLIPFKNSWDYVKDVELNIKKSNVDIVMMSCGPMSRYLCYKMYKENPSISFIDIGSTFDPFTKNLWHRCHKGTLKYCKECNFG
jgi:hypothetical protein